MASTTKGLVKFIITLVPDMKAVHVVGTNEVELIFKEHWPATEEADKTT